MRTRTLALTAAISAISAAAMADVVSVNVVGFVNLPLQQGFNLVCPPLKATNDTVGAILPTVPDGVSVQRWDPVAQSFLSAITFDSGAYGGWEDPNMPLIAGEAVFISVPPGGAFTATFVGEVRQGPAMATALRPGFNFVGSQWPQEGAITAALQFSPTDADSVQSWNPTAQTYNSAVTYDVGAYGGWEIEPVLKIGEGVVISTTIAKDWTQNFSVQ